MVATNNCINTSLCDSPPQTQHWEGRAPDIKESMAGKSGRLAPRWIHDLLLSELDVGSFASIRWDPNARCTRPTAPHTLVLVGNQSTADSKNPGVLSCVCTRCDYHFIIRTAWDPDRSINLCEPYPHHFPPKKTDFYLHHLVNVEQSPQQHDFTSGYHALIRESLIAVEHFACSAPRCTFKVTAEISRPRLKREWVQLLTDQKRILANLDQARKQSPDRFSDARDDWCASAPSTLNTYLRDLLDKPDLRNISKRNKRFQVVFGEECYDIFRAIHFKEEPIDKDGVPEPYFIPPILEPGNPGTPTRLDTLRAFVEDMQAEAESLIIRNGGPGETRQDGRNRVYKQLQCLDYPQRMSTPPHSDAHRVLGVLPNFTGALMFYAYLRQSALCEKRRVDYVHALCDIAQETNDEEFQTRAVQELTMVERQPSPDYHGPGGDLEQEAYAFFSLQHTASEDEVISAYYKKVEDSPSQADFAKEMLQIIGRHRYNDSIFSCANGSMDLATAYRFLDCDSTWTDNHIQMMCQVMINKSPENKGVAAQALKALAAIAAERNSEDLREAMVAFEGSLKLPDEAEQGALNTNSSTEPPLPRLRSPAGLENIGNTCYLNSILQYLRTVIPLRNLLAHYHKHQLSPQYDDFGHRLIGGNKMKIEKAEAVIARIFVEELRKLLYDLDNTRQTAIRPSQRLANAVLLPPEQIKEEAGAVENGRTEEQNTHDVMGAQFPMPPPPPLPARPAPVPPTDVDQGEDTDMINVTVDPVSRSVSSVSSQTLVSMPDAQEKAHGVEDKSDVKLIHDQSDAPSNSPAPAEEDTQMTDAKPPTLTIEEKVYTALETQKRSSGTDQQDVSEVMSNIINRLQAAIRAVSVTADGIQWESIMETFFVEVVTHRKKPNQQSFNAVSIWEEAIRAYPAENGPSTIHEGLGRNFGLQRVAASDGDDIMQYSSIKRLPPILHVIIQRTQKGGFKNMNPVQVSEILYLDRYMDTLENSDFFKLREKGWALQQRLDELNDLPRTSTQELVVMDKFIHRIVCNRSEFKQKSGGDGDTSLAEQSTTSLLAEQPTSSLSFAGEDISMPNYASESKPTHVEFDPPSVSTSEARERITKMREDEVKQHKAEMDELFSQQKEHAYCLHAVICHSGHLNAGHYWVWIHDFEEDTWHKYNDGVVTKTSSTADVLRTLNSNGDPYYLCYVQDEKKLELVRVPKHTVSQDMVDTELVDAP